MRLAGFATFGLIACIPVLVVLATPNVVVQDGGLHLSNAVALRGLIGGWFPSLVDWRAVLSPNMTVELVLAAFTCVLDADDALRWVVVIGLLGFAASVAALVRAAGLPLYMGIPLLAFEMHYFVMLGFLGFVWAVPLSLGAVAVVVRRPLTPATWPLLGLLLASWFTHIVPALVATIAAISIVFIAHLAEGERPSGAASATLRTLALPVASMALLTMVWFFQTRTTGLYQGHATLDSMKALLQFSAPLVSYANAEKWVARILAVTVYALATLIVIKRFRDRRYLVQLDGLLAAAILLTLLAITLPEHANSGAGYIGVRLTLFATLLLILWVCSQLTSAGGRVGIAGIGLVATATVVAIAVPIVRIPTLNRLSAQSDQIEDLAACLPLYSTLIQLNYDLGGEGTVRGLSPMAEQTGAITVGRKALDLGNESGWFPFYVWRYADTARVDRYLKPGDHFDDVPPPLNLNALLAGGIPLTAVILYGRKSAPPRVLSTSKARTLDEDLADRFRRVRVSDEGNAELWLRNDVTPSC